MHSPLYTARIANLYGQPRKTARIKVVLDVGEEVYNPRPVPDFPEWLAVTYDQHNRDNHLRSIEGFIQRVDVEECAA